jgi:DNA-binding GntR family transcriptional regulator
MINKYSNVPLYSQLKKIIICKIDSGEFKEDTKIPSEQDFCEKYGISRPTVRQAITELTNNGYLYKKKGKGTFVAKAKTKIDIKDYTGFTASILNSEDFDQINVISTKSFSGEDNKFLEKLFTGQNADSEEQYAEIRYTVSQNSEVISFNTSYIPLNLFPDIIEDVNNKNPSHEILKGKYPLVPAKAKSSIEIVYTEQEDAQYLHVQTGLALIKVDNILYSKNGLAVEYVIAKYRSDKCRICFKNFK